MNHSILRKFEERFSKSNQKKKGDITVMCREEEFMLGTEQPSIPCESQSIPCNPDPIGDLDNPLEFGEPSELTETAAENPNEFEKQNEPDEMPVSVDNVSVKLDEIATALALMDGKLDTVSEQVSERTRESKETVSYLDEFFRKFINARETVAEQKLEKINLNIMDRIDDIDRSVDYYENVEFTEKAYSALLKNYKNLRKRMMYLLSMQDISAFDLGNQVVFEGEQQDIISTVPTDDPTLDETVCEVLRIGYKQGDKILRSERVSVYKFNG